MTAWDWAALALALLIALRFAWYVGGQVKKG